MRPSLSEPDRAKPRVLRGWCLGIALLVALAPAALAGQATTDTTRTIRAPAGECCQSLVMPLGARAVALGRAVVADTGGEVLFSNPAGIVGLHRAQLEFYFRQLPSDTKLLGVTFVAPPRRFGTFALTYTLFDLGTFPITDKFNNVIGSTYSQMHVLGATFATRIVPQLTAGLTYKVFVWITPCGGCDTKGASGTTQAVDLGMQYRPSWNRWVSLGAALTNAGIPLQVVNFEQSDQPPTRGRVGARYEVLHLFQRDSTLTGSVSAQLELGGPPGPVPALGAEVTVGDVVALRAGWRSFGQSTNTYGGSLDAGLTLGVGLKYQRYSVAVARAVQTQDLDTAPFQVTFGMSF